ncbi:MAG: hypothetical protein ACLQDY_00185 [Streptosporangiaceae bacterium]
MDWGAVLQALLAVAGIISKLVSFGQDSSSNDQPQLNAIESELEGLAGDIQQYSTQILAAISTLSQEVFGNEMAGLLSYADQAGVALAEWEQTQNSESQGQALTASEAGLAGIIEEYNGEVYPATSMMLVMGRVLLSRVAILTIFPSFVTSTDTQQVQTGVGYLSASISPVTAYINSGNQVRVSSQVVNVTTPLGKPGIHYYVVTVYYANIEGNVTYNKSATGATLAAAMQAAQPLIAQAEQAQAQGLADDLNYYQVTAMDQVVQQVNKWLAGHGV